MPFALLILGLILAVLGFYRFFLKASAHQIKTMILSAVAVTVILCSAFLTLTGRLPAAIAILIALWPLAVSYLRNRPHAAAPDVTMSLKEAYEILGLDDGASDEDVKAAHLRLMKKVHPDQKGSDWLAKKINAAKDLLLKST